MQLPIEATSKEERKREKAEEKKQKLFLLKKQQTRSAAVELCTTSLAVRWPVYCVSLLAVRMPTAETKNKGIACLLFPESRDC